MIEIKERKKIDTTTIIHKLTKTEQLNTAELAIIKQGQLQGIAPVELNSSIWGKKLQAVISGYVDVASYLKSGIQLEDFRLLLQAILDVLEEIKKIGLRVSNLEIRPEYIYYDHTKKQARMLYWPIISLDKYADEKVLFRKLVKAYESKLEDESFKDSWISFLNSKRKLDFEQYKDWIASLSIDTPSTDNKNTIEVDDKGFGEKTIRSGEFMGESDLVGRTVALFRPVLMRVEPNIRIELSNSPFIIGRSPDDCDYVIADNPCVSRKHAFIWTTPSGTYIEDNNSMNGVIVDGEEIPKKCRIPLSFGSTIEIGNIEFKYFSPMGGNKS